MIEALNTLPLAALMFAATNADDLVLLGIFFARPGCRTKDIVLGQLVGIGAITAISFTLSTLALSVPHGWLPWIGIIPMVIGVKWLRRTDDNDAPEAASVAWWSVAGITIANGADNLGVYIPAFSMQSGFEKVVTGAVFLVLTLVWCGFAPFVLIGIGLWIVLHHPMFGLKLGPIGS